MNSQLRQKQRRGGPRPGKGRVAEWSKAADCKSVEVFLRRFESCLSHLFVVDFREEKRGIRQRRKANRAKLLWPFREVQLYRMLVREVGELLRSIDSPSISNPNENRSDVVVGPTHPICSMIYGSTGATHFDQLAKILTGYEITGARSSAAQKKNRWKSRTFSTVLYPEQQPSRQAKNALVPFPLSIRSSLLVPMIESKAKLKCIAFYDLRRWPPWPKRSQKTSSFIVQLGTYAFAIVSALRQSRVKYIADLGALAKTNPISAITFSITMFSYAGIPPLAGFCSKFYLFFAALGCGAYFLAPVGVVTSVIGRWAAGRLPRLGKNGEVHPNRPMKNKRRAKRQWRAKRMRNGHGEKEGSLEEKQPSSFPSLPGPKAVQGESGASRSTVERKIFGPSSFSTGFQTFLQHRFRKEGGTQVLLCAEFDYYEWVAPRFLGTGIPGDRAVGVNHYLLGGIAKYMGVLLARIIAGRIMARRFERHVWHYDFQRVGYTYIEMKPVFRGSINAVSHLNLHFRGLFAELIETLAWAHERTPLANLIRWREKPVALSIVQARLLGLAHFSVGYILTYAVCLASIFRDSCGLERWNY
ncbi:NADH dehydrogenase subunit 2 [Tanacetum coccineum]